MYPATIGPKAGPANGARAKNARKGVSMPNEEEKDMKKGKRSSKIEEIGKRDLHIAFPR